MARCGCAGQSCGCRIEQGEGVQITGAGSARNPYVISAEGGGGGGGGWLPGDYKETSRSGPAPAGWLDCDGSAVSRTAFPSLFDEIGTRYGPGDGFSTFNVPTVIGRAKIGQGPGYTLGATGGNAQTTLVVSNLPPHTHSMAHTHTMAHTHSINHDHPSAGTTNSTHAHTFTTRQRQGEGGSGALVTVTDVGGATGSGGELKQGTTAGNTHNHVVNIPAFTGNSGGASNGTTSQPSTGNTGSTGQASPFSNMPPYLVVRVLIKT